MIITLAFTAIKFFNYRALMGGTRKSILGFATAANLKPNMILWKKCKSRCFIETKYQKKLIVLLLSTFKSSLYLLGVRTAPQVTYEEERNESAEFISRLI